VARARKQYEAKNGVQCSIRLDGKIVGVMGFGYVDRSNRKCEMGCWMSESCQGCGITTTAVLALIDYAFSNWKMNRVEIRTGDANVKSRAVAKRLGFTYESNLREAEWVNDRYVDHAV
jgi:ribosomal-protein-serine acetyltransferase